jgi:hypothetical protein
MMNRIPYICILALFISIITGCDAPPNPLVGRWQQISPPAKPPGQIIEFTPSTMRIDNKAVTVIYQVRDNKLRVSASKSAIIYEFDDADSVHYEDEQHGTVRLVRILP